MQEFMVCKMSDSILSCFYVSSVWCYKWGCVMQRRLRADNVNGVVGGAVLGPF